MLHPVCIIYSLRSSPGVASPGAVSVLVRVRAARGAEQRAGGRARQQRRPRPRAGDGRRRRSRQVEGHAARRQVRVIIFLFQKLHPYYGA